MKITAIAFVASLFVLILAGPARAELYGYSISASDTDPWVNQAAPGVGFYVLHLWLSCGVDDAQTGGFGLVGSLSDRVLGWVESPWCNIVDVGGLGFVWGTPGGTVLAPIPLMQINVFDAMGTGGALCIVGPDDDYPLPWVSSDWPTFETAAAMGFTSDGTAPCVVGFCEGPVAVEEDSWGRVKSLYR